MPQRETGLMPVCAFVHLRALARMCVRVRACVRACVRECVRAETCGEEYLHHPRVRIVLCPAGDERKKTTGSGVRSRRASRLAAEAPHDSPAPQCPRVPCRCVRRAALRRRAGRRHTYGGRRLLHYCTASRRATGPAPVGSVGLTHSRTHSPDVDAARVALERLHGTPRSPLTGMQARSVQPAAHGAPCPPMGHGRGNNAHASLPGKLRETSGNVEKRRETSRNVGKRRKTSGNVGRLPKLKGPRCVAWLAIASFANSAHTRCLYFTNA